ncbi:GGDEF domain-containing protein [Thiomonas intermedia]|uniref:GGDEF domain-containing protein n=1 Tax=Thiomonas intermedia TaxID=926 RepID=UPI0009A51876|nr:diguanylate cyclase [Thiomonas intermedia]
MRCALQEGLPSLGVLFGNMADAVYLLDPITSNILWCNPSAHASLGLESGEVLNHSVLSLQMDVTGLPQWADIAGVIRGASCYTFLGRHRHKDGGEVPVEVNTTAFTLGGREYFLSVARDISRRMSLEGPAGTQDERLRFALNLAMDGLWDWNMRTDEVYFSPQLKRMLGYGPDEMAPHVDTWKRNIHPDDRDQVMSLIEQHLRGRLMRFEAEYRLRNRNGHDIWVHDRGQVCERDAQGRPTRVVGMVQNVTDRKLLELRLEKLASIDDLTQLPNRRAGMAFLSHQMALSERTGEQLSLGVLDIDAFKSVNDRFGHAQGDEVLHQVAMLLRETVRTCDYLYRSGGEEFILVFPGADREKADAIAADIHAALEAKDWEGELGMPAVTVSIGLASYPQDLSLMHKLLDQADLALYRAKELGRNRTCHARDLLVAASAPPHVARR